VLGEDHDDAAHHIEALGDGAAGRERHRFAAVEEASDKFTIPADWEDATSKQSGQTFAIVGPWVTSWSRAT
jgi:hypothetical protein